MFSFIVYYFIYSSIMETLKPKQHIIKHRLFPSCVMTHSNNDYLCNITTNDVLYYPIIYAIVRTSTLRNVDFGQVKQTSADTVRKSTDGFFSILSWRTINTPTFIEDDSVKLIWIHTKIGIRSLVETNYWRTSFVSY